MGLAVTAKRPNQHWAYRPCAGPDCDRELRSRHYPAELAPGTHIAAGLGMCNRDYRRAKDAQVVNLVMDDKARSHVSSLEYFLNTTRRNRGIPAEGLLRSIA